MNNSQLISNGRVDILAPIGPQFSFADKIPIKDCVTNRDALTGNWIDTPLSIAFFSIENIKILQNAIKKGVYEKSNKQFFIDEQNYEELQIIMRSIFLQNSKNLPSNITNQIVTLNNLIIEYAVNQVYNEAVSYIKYKRDASTMYNVLNHPSNTSNKNNTLELQKFI